MSVTSNAANLGLPAGVQAGSRPAATGCHHEHLVEFYQSEDFLVETVAGFVDSALKSGDAAIVVATAAHREAFQASLRVAGADVDEAIAAGSYRDYDAAEMLSSFMVDGAPDPQRFRAKVGAEIERAVAGGRRVRIYGEMVAILWGQGDVPSAMALEHLWNELADTHEFALLCGHPMTAFVGEASRIAFQKMCHQHTTVIPSEGYSRLDDPDQQQRVVATLQQGLLAMTSDATRLRAERETFAELANADALTGLANRRAFDQHLEREWGLTQRDEVKSFVLVADLDGFKAFNDLNGHANGDDALRLFASLLRAAARRTDIVARIGGDEFAVLLARCEESAAHKFTARVRDAMAGTSWPGQGVLTVSLGHASLHRSTSAAKALERADLAMFAHKHEPRKDRRRPARG